VALNHLFLDFNAFFASCEQHLRPELRGKPVGVVAVRTENTCCLAASYEAKRQGVKTGTMVREARRLCPGMLFVEARPAEYVELHENLRKIVETQMHVDAVHSIDEMSCRLTGRWREREAARALALQIKAAIREKAGPVLRCSIGVAPNLFLAKTASDMQKPDGLVVLDEAEWPEALAKLELRDLCGIGPRMEARLRRAGLGTVAQLVAADRAQLRQAWGSVQGERLWEKLRGRDWDAEPARKTCFGHSHVLEPALRNEPKARAVLHRLLQKAAMRLRAKGYYAGMLVVAVDLLGEHPGEEDDGWSGEASLEPTQDTVELTQAMDALWERERPLRDGRRPLRVAVTLTQLEYWRDHTPSLFATEAGRRRGLLRVLDGLNQIHGYGAVYWAGAHAAQEAAPMRIAFNRIPERELEQEAERGRWRKGRKAGGGGGKTVP
jgi:DNA polymerase-4